MSKVAKNQGIQNLLATEGEYAAPVCVASRCLQQDWQGEVERALVDPEGFWGNYARNFTWTRPWTKVLEWDGVHHEWFVGAKTNITINALDRHANSDHRNRAAFIWLGEDGSERIITYGQLYRQVCRFANGLKSLGLNKGDRVIVYMPLTIEAVIAMLACARIGAIHSVVYAGLGHGALRDRIVDAEARMIIAGDIAYRRGKTIALMPIVREALNTIDSVEKIVVFSRSATEIHRPREVDFNDLFKFASDCPAEEMDAEDPLFLLYTSGSTGKPKGVLHVHGGYMVGTTYHVSNLFDVGVEDIFWCMSDIGWAVGHSYITYAPLCAGVTTLFREGAIDFPHPGIVWEIVERYGVTKMFTAPTAIRMFMRNGEQYPGKYDISSLRLIACAGEPLNPEAWHWAQTHLAGNGKWGYIIDNWWQTELGGPAIATPPSMPMRPGKVGVAVPGCVADVVDEEGKSNAPGVGGRLVLKRPFPHMLRTIWRNAARYERDWQQIPGSYVTGDVAVKDKDGYITVLGRADDVLNVAGHRIGTAEVESALISHPAVAEAAAIGVPDPIKGESIKVFVQTRAGHDPSETLSAALIEHVRRELGPIATPSALEFVSALPKTRSGKILRRFLKAQETGKDAGDVSMMEG